MNEASPRDTVERYLAASTTQDRRTAPTQALGTVRVHSADRLGDGERLEAEIVPAGEFTGCLDSWDDLVQRALIPNVYMHPAVARAADLHGGRHVVVVLVWRICLSRRTLMGAWSLAPAKRATGFSVLDTSLNRLVFAGTPVLDAGLAADVLDKMLDAIDREPKLPKIIAATDLNADPRLLSSLSDVIARRRSRALVVGARSRAMLTRQTAGESATQLGISSKQKRESRRTSRRLAEAGIEHVAMARGSEIADAFRSFLQIEASGWKGKKAHKGWAIGLDPALGPLAADMIQGLMRTGCARIDAFRRGENWIAFSISLRSGSRAFGWKMTYDEAFSSFGPGRLLSELVTTTFLADTELEIFDSCNGSGVTFHSAIWPERLPFVDIVIDAREGGSWSGTIFMILELSRRKVRASLRIARDAVRTLAAQAV